jgi:hypothetical protein
MPATIAFDDLSRNEPPGLSVEDDVRADADFPG